MPRVGRLDAPGVLQHIMIRGSERRNIFRDATDREEFLARVARLVPDTQTACYAWVRMPNHGHLLLRTGAAPLPPLMRRVLPGYAVRFNRRHQRHGLLVQNRSSPKHFSLTTKAQRHDRKGGKVQPSGLRAAP